MVKKRAVTLAHDLGQLGDVRRDPPRLVFREQLRWFP
jgi:hypothetical protein